MEWTPELKKQVAYLWYEGFTATEIGKEMKVTRNAIIGLVHRNFFKRKDGYIPHKYNYHEKRIRKPRVRKYSPKPVVYEDTEVGLMACHPKLFSQLQLGDCRWPVGDPKHPDFFFCGAIKKDSSPYCTFHSNLAYRVSQKKRVA